jgi:DNA polymerase III epsilon subunit-like protein
MLAMLWVLDELKINIYNTGAVKMSYMVFDLEFNQGYNFEDENIKVTNSNCPFEIIDIGAVKLDKNFNTIATFDELVKPAVYTRLNPFIEKLTGISEDSLNTAKPFTLVYRKLLEFIADVKVLCVWGTADIKELIRNINYYNLEDAAFPRKYINVQYYVSRQLRLPSSTVIGLANAARLMDITIETQLHKAYNDAYYTAEIFKKLNHKNIDTKIYNTADERNRERPKNIKTTLDTDKLIAQFEKMFDRKMTLEEQSIIRLSYKMGNSNQFQK